MELFLIRVLVADDQALVRRTIGLLVDTAADLEVVGETAIGAEAVEIATQQKPDMLLMDIRMPGIDGIQATRPRRLRLRGAAGRGERVPAQGHRPADLLAAIRVIAAGDDGQPVMRAALRDIGQASGCRPAPALRR